jgi:acetyl-CoA C-acetyltransferase
MAAKRFNRGVALVGAGMSNFGAFPGKTTRDLFVEAFKEMHASVDKGFDPKDIDECVFGNYSSSQFEGQGFTAPFIANAVGMNPRPAIRTENACASSGTAIRVGIMAIASGMADMVLVGGYEKETDQPTAKVTEILATASDNLYENVAGFTFPGLYAALATAYMNRYGATTETMMKVAWQNHENGALNPKAQFGKKISDFIKMKQRSAEKKGKPIPEWEDDMAFLRDPTANPVISWPLRLFDCSPVSDGAAALLLVAEDMAHNFTDKPLHIIGTGLATGVPTHDRSDLTMIEPATLAGQAALEMAGVSPKDIQVCEVHDCFTMTQVISTEDLGFFERGEGWKALEEGRTARDGDRPINTSGGLKSKGHPVGASGVGQVVEIWKQLRGEAGERQLPGEPTLGLSHNLGGSGQVCVVNVFERR